MAATRRGFPEAESLSFRKVAISSAMKEQIKSDLGFSWSREITCISAKAGDSLLGIGIIDHVRGKDQFITYLVICDTALQVVSVEILVYREPYGGEITQQAWLDQFRGKGPASPMRHGKEIKNITGATISARSVARGVQQVLSVARLLAPDILTRTP